MEIHTHVDRVGKGWLATYPVELFDLLFKRGLLLA